MPKPSYIRYGVVFLLVVALGVIFAGSLLARPSERINPRDEDPNKIVDANLRYVISNQSPFEPTSNCKQCHRTLIEEWYTSQHYYAWRNPIFQENYADYIFFLDSPEPSPAFIPIVEAEEVKAAERPAKRKEKYREPEPPAKVELNVLEVKENTIGQEIHDNGRLLPEGIVDNKVQVNCLICHAPGADFTMDGKFVLQSNNEGVFCDYCHLIVDRSDEGYLLYPDSKIKQGPFIEPVTSSHPVEYSGLHTTSEFCKNCHQYENPAGVKVLNTFSEWQNSPYAESTEKTTCQDCHMPSYRGRASVNSDIRPAIKSHYFAGGHNRGFMVDAATVNIGEMEITEQDDGNGGISGYNIHVPVEVSNERAGHDFPSGWPLRQLVLVVRLKSEDSYDTYGEGKVVYEKVYGDFWGNRTYNIWEITQVLADRDTWSEEGIDRGVGPLGVGEMRTEDFDLMLDSSQYDEYEDGDLFVTAQLFYRLMPEGYTAKTDIPSPFRINADVEYVMLP